jgi:putative inorganic carbon (HCO3(-)) transporter
MHPASSPRQPAPGTMAAARLQRPPAWDALLMCVAGYVADAVGRLQSLFPILRPFKPALICAAGAIILYLAQQGGLRHLGALRSRTTTAVLLLLVWAALSVPAALNQGAAFFFLTGFFIKTVLLYVLVAGAVRAARDVERLALVYFGAAVLYSTIVLLRFDVGGSNWRLASLYTYDANDFATFAVTAIPLGLYFTTSGTRPPLRTASALGLAVLTTAFVRSGSRGGFLAIIAVALFVLLGYTTIRTRWRVLGTAALAALFIATASDRYWSQMRTIVAPEQDYNRTAETGRLQIWRRGLGYMLTHPLVGVGAANFGVAEGTISPLAKLQEYNIGVRWTAAHNSLVQVGAELGIPGLLLFLTALGGAFATLRRVARAGPAAPLAHALTGSLIGFAVGGFFLSLAYHDMLYTLLGLATGLGKVCLPRAPAAPRAGSRFAHARPPVAPPGRARPVP